MLGRRGDDWTDTLWNRVRERSGQEYVVPEPVEMRLSVLVTRICGWEALIAGARRHGIPAVIRRYYRILSEVGGLHGANIDGTLDGVAQLSFGSLAARLDAGGAVRAAVRILRDGSALGAGIKEIGDLAGTLGVCAGMATGECLVGMFGGTGHASYTTIGDCGHRAIALSGAALAGELLLDEETAAEALKTAPEIVAGASVRLTDERGRDVFALRTLPAPDDV